MINNWLILILAHKMKNFYKFIHPLFNLSLILILLNMVCLQSFANDSTIVADTISKPDTINISQTDTIITPVSISQTDTSFLELRHKQELNNQYDEIITTLAETLKVTVVSKNLYEVTFYYPLNKDVSKLNIKNVVQINYADGKVDKFNHKYQQKPKEWEVKKSEKDYDKVEVFYNADEVSGFNEIGAVECEYVAAKLGTSNNLVEKGGLIMARRKALKMGATVLLITEKKIDRPYGEPPIINIRGIAYTRP